MSPSRFASITSSLLARKGEATPWEEPGKRLLSWATDPLHPSPDPTSFINPPAEPKPAPENLSPQFGNQPAADCQKGPDKMKKCVVRVSSHDYDRLGILAVKRGITRHRLLQEALKQFLVEQARPYEQECPCLSRSDCVCPQP